MGDAADTGGRDWYMDGRPSADSFRGRGFEFEFGGLSVLDRDVLEVLAVRGGETVSSEQGEEGVSIVDSGGEGGSSGSLSIPVESFDSIESFFDR